MIQIDRVVNADRDNYDLVCHFDGGCNNKTHSNAYGSYRIRNKNLSFHPRVFTYKYPDVNTSNEAEYEAMKYLLRAILSHFISKGWVGKILVIGDSALVVNQLSGIWKVSSPNLASPHKECSGLLKMIREKAVVNLMWVPRTEIVEVLGH